MNYTYIPRCGDGRSYTGRTKDREKRVKAHQSGKGGKYTRAHQPVELAWFEAFADKCDAMRREYEITQLSRQEKLTLIRGETK